MKISTRSIARIGNLALVGAIAIVVVIFGVRGLASRRTVTVPDVRGMTAVGALSVLSSARLTGRLAESVSDSVTAEGRVAMQQPLAGTLVRRETIVRINLSAGPEFVLVPDLRAVPLDSARALLASVGLISGAVDTVTDSLASGRVVTTHPAAGGRARRATHVMLTVSAGAASINVPDLGGLTRAEAVEQIVAAGLKVGSVRVMSEAATARVTAQRPAARALVVAGTPVELTINEAGP